MRKKKKKQRVYVRTESIERYRAAARARNPELYSDAYGNDEMPATRAVENALALAVNVVDGFYLETIAASAIDNFRAMSLELACAVRDKVFEMQADAVCNDDIKIVVDRQSGELVFFDADVAREARHRIQLRDAILGFNQRPAQA